MDCLLFTIFLSTTLLPIAFTSSFKYFSFYAHKDKDSYFGYSLATYIDQGMPYTVVGAPREKVNSWKEDNVSRIGRAHRCGADLNADWNACENVPSAIRTSNVNTKYKIVGHSQPNSRAEQWFGATVSATSVGNDGYFTVCAPRFLYSPSKGSWIPIGECLLYPGLPYNYHVISPCKGEQDLAQCQAGFSASVLGFTNPNKQSVLYFLTGLPGSYDGNGDIYVSKFVAKSHTNSWAYHKQSDVANLLKDQSNRSSYLGYQVQLVNLYSQSPKRISILATRGMWGAAKWKGSVSVLDIYMSELIHINDTFGHIGDIFGYSVTSADLDGNGISDIIIGSPYYANTSLGQIDVGRVYVYYASLRSDDKFTVNVQNPVILESEWPKGRFGHAVTNIGDIDDDGLDDIAVGCPYCGNNHLGMVFIYHSRRGRSISKQPYQILRSEDDVRKPKTFGWSVAGGVDFDLNGYPDLTVGAYKSARIIQYRARPVIRLSMTNISSPRIIGATNCSDTSVTQFPNCLFNISITLVARGNHQQQVPFNVTFDLDSQIREDGKKRLVSADTGESYFVRAIQLSAMNSTQKITERVMVRQTLVAKNSLTPFTITIKSSINQPDDFITKDKLTPILHPTSTTNITLPAINIYRKECGIDNICHPDLAVTMQELTEDTSLSEVLFYGQLHTPKKIQIRVRNNGEPAYQAKLLLTMPSPISVALVDQYLSTERSKSSGSINVRCREDVSNVTRTMNCHLGNSLTKHRYGAEIVLEFQLYFIKMLSSGMEPVTVIKAVAKSVNEEKLGQDFNNAALLTYTVYMNTEVSATAKPHANVVIDDRKEPTPIKSKTIRMESLGQYFNHTFYVVNTGPSPMTNVQVTIKVPYKTALDEFVTYFLNQVTTIVSGSSTMLTNLSPRVLDVTTNQKRGSCHYIESTMTTNNLNLNILINKQQSAPINENRVRRSTDYHQEEKLQKDSPESKQSTFTDIIRGATRSTARETIQCGFTSELLGHIYCQEIQCTIDNMTANDQVVIAFDGVLMAETLFKYRASEIKLVSTALITIPKPPYYLPWYPKVGVKNQLLVSATQSFLFRGVKSRPIQKTSPWIIILAVILGILLLVIIIVLMWKCGFFKRATWKQQQQQQQQGQEEAAKL